MTADFICREYSPRLILKHVGEPVDVILLKVLIFMLMFGEI